MILFLDCASGASGDMLAAALADLAGRLGHDAGAEVARALAAVGIDAAAVRLSPPAAAASWPSPCRSPTGPGSPPSPNSQRRSPPPALPGRTAERVGAVAARMAAAERAVHGGADEPHLHELAGLDTAVDLLAAAALVELLGPERIVASPPALGGGSVSGSHGVLPGAGVPRSWSSLPRAAHRAAGGTEQDGELTTPTGAALLAELVDEWRGLPAGRIAAVGAGAGGREIPGAANVLRALLVDQADAAAAPRLRTRTAARSSCWRPRIDDATAEVLAYAADACARPARWTCGSRRRS